MNRLFAPRFLLLHLLVVGVLVATTLLGLWQFRRHAEVSDDNAQLLARVDQAPIGLREIAAPGDPEAFTYTVVEVTGTYARDEEVLVRNRARRGINGHHVVTPLILDGDSAVLVNRGWVPIDVTQPDTGAARAPEGEVTVRGFLLPSQEASGLGARDPEEGELDVVFRIDVDRIAQQLSVPEVFPGYVQLDEQTPPQSADVPSPVAAPTADAGPHLGYALQWFGIGLTAAIAYGFYLRSRLSEEQA